MNLADVRAELEEELAWREEEIRFLKNQMTEMKNDDERERFRRALVVMLYSHFEGYWRAAFSTYVKAINSTSTRCGEAVRHLVAASLWDILEALVDSNRKCDFFRTSAPNDVKLHQYHRHAEFLTRLTDVDARTLSIAAEKVVDPESNLTPAVIRKNLFRLGFDHELFKAHEGTVNQLLNRRNLVAHGATRQGVTETDYNTLEAAVFDIMGDIVRLIFSALREKKYLRAPEIEFAI